MANCWETLKPKQPKQMKQVTNSASTFCYDYTVRSFEKVTVKFTPNFSQVERP